MEFKMIGNGDFESTCLGCGERLLFSEGDMLNFRTGDSLTVDGNDFPIIEGFLCVLCNKKENPSEPDRVLRFGRMCCESCGKELSPFNYEGFEVCTDESGLPTGVVCEDCKTF